MTIPLYSLLGFVVWTLLLVFVVGGWRTPKVLRGEVRISGFPAGVPHGDDWYWRANRAHSNCVENLPLFAAVVLTAEIVGVQSSLLDAASVVYLVGRIGQSIAHISSASDAAVRVRFGCFLVQIVALSSMIAIVAIAGA